jgi:AcrR family transcriptional regulator
MQQAPAITANPSPSLETFRDKRAHMLSVAEEVLLSEGFHASMDTIAARAKVAKQTVYNHFGSKEGLFSEVVRRIADTITDALFEPDRDLRAALLGFALSLRTRALCPQGISTYRALVAEAPRFPELALLIYAKGPRTGRDALAMLFRQKMAAGELMNADPELAAELFIGMLTGYDRARLLFGAERANTAIVETAKCEQTVDTFLRAYSPNQCSSVPGNPERPACS